MEELGETLALNPNLSCKVCCEKEFEEREGFYYCLECGTKQDQVRAVEVEHNEDLNDRSKISKKIKIQSVKAEKPRLTSWECYNYILRGYVEELLSFGAKEELRLMTLQVWAAYLRRTEVAFFNKKQPDLPKLGIIYLPNDAETIYNHSMEARKKRKKRRGDGDTSCTSGGESTSMSAKDYRKSKRKLDESIYSLTSVSAFSGLTSSTSANSNKAIKLAFNARARKIAKRKMPIKHLKRHENDPEYLLECHKPPKSREVKSTDYAMMLMNLKNVYSILAIALNLTNDDIQLCDLLRFVNEGHLGPNNVLQYFPENIASNGKEILRRINFYNNKDKYSDKTVRDYICVLCKKIGIQKLKTPSIIKLTRRYVSELALPNKIATYCERLINILPPQFETRAKIVYPGYEARAMAYIIFILKLLFGLDGEKEQRMSQASKKLNNEIEQLNLKHNEKQPLLFIWNEWVEYIEMRKVIVSHFNPNFCEQFNQCQSTTQLLEQMAEEIRRNTEQENLINDVAKHDKLTQRLESVKGLFERFKENLIITQTEDKKKQMHYIEFKPSFTPGLSYFKSILLHCDHENSLNSNEYFKIPEFMSIDHAQRDVNSYLIVKPLIEYFQKHQKELKVYDLPSPKNRSYVGIFRAPRSQFPGTEARLTQTQKPCFKISEEKWAEKITREVSYSTDDLEYKTVLANYKKRYYACLNRKKTNKLHDKDMDFDLSQLHQDDREQNIDSCADNLYKTNSEYRKKVLNLSDGHDMESMHSFDLFKETNMDPIQTDDFIKRPRRNLDQINLFDGISDEESILNDAEDNYETNDDTSVHYNNSAVFVPSLEDCTPLGQEEFIDSNTEIHIKQEFINSNSRDQTSNTTQKEKTLELYTSNMDCWMLLGSISMLSRGQKAQLQDKFPRSFSWLLETCAQTLNIEWPTVYEHLLSLELMFGMGIEDPEKIKNCIFIKSLNPIKDFQALVNHYREIW